MQRHLFDSGALGGKNVLFAIGVGVGVIGVGVLLNRLVGRKRSRVVQVGTVSQVLVYPVKSCKGMAVSKAACLEMGLKYGETRDRQWLVIQEDGHMVTARQIPQLVLVSVSADDTCLCLNAQGMEELRVPFRLPSSLLVKTCRVWGCDIQGRDCGDEPSQWLTRYANSETRLHLVQFELSMKPRSSKDTEKLFSPKDKVMYPDCSPILLLSEASVEDLNGRLEKKASVANFRPNIVVAGCEPFAEDSWDELQIGSIRLHRVMSCGRCIMTTVDPETGIIDRKQPLETLKSYRQCDPAEQQIYKTSPKFGQYYSVDTTGVLQVGDPVYMITY
ncbi:mitochondrial amidoxime-reducing component 1 [Erpetoichthys calabaricus]|uniref:Mitochondrial amidoxime reducing component 2 n=1 Tax=Erpetoichthys calabaricus TaxID=27687 RepID=A0A8C4SVD9_ERPCA|nr:mitochondrial amidoxime-reducing component 1 [Erpetoichthys calabaricus]